MTEQLSEQNKGPFLTRKKGNLVIKKVMALSKIEVKGLPSAAGKIDFQFSDKKVTMNVSLNTFEAIACDPETGEENTYVIFGYIKPEVA